MATEIFAQPSLPPFQQIATETIVPNLCTMLNEHRAALKRLLSSSTVPTWSTLMQPLEDMGDELNQFWSPISHLHGVMQSESLRKAYNEALPLLTEYHTELSQNESLYQAVLALSQSDAFKQLTKAQQKIIENDLRDFKLAGIALPLDKKARMAELNLKLSELTTRFSENLLDATNAWSLTIADEATLAGLPDQAKQLASDNAKERNVNGFVFTLDYPSYSTAIKFLDNRVIRQQLYTAFVTRASDVNDDGSKWDNTQIMEDILKVRHEIAALVGFENFAEYSLATKMADKPADVLNFLSDLLSKSKPMADSEYQEIAALAMKDGITDLQSWDVPYYSEKLQVSKFQFTQEDFRPYFPIQPVLNGLFGLVSKLYGITIKEQTNIETWHNDVRFFALYDNQGDLRGGFYIDLYARPNKRDGAWMDECRVRRQLKNKQIQHPVAYLTCNFMRPVSNKPALLTHDDVLTLFHEFGHCLHHMLTKVDFASVSGINGVPWDAVEFPSQFMENFCYEKELLQSISAHYQTGEPLPDELYNKLLAAKHFQTGLQMVRQLEFSLFDFRLHLEYDPTKTKQVQAMLNNVRKLTAVASVPEFNRFQHSFSHIFAGGYAAGYYSYKWAEVLSSDAYAKFEEQGLYDPSIGQAFMQHILEVGGVRDPMESFVAFRGRKPTVDALLRHSGITANTKKTKLDT